MKVKQVQLLKPYVYECLKEYGNTIMSIATFNHLKRKKIIQDLENNGIYDCHIRYSQKAQCYVLELLKEI